jgi:endonuclease/exonuclease/phosphatase family metal-dependent hydrolase
MATNRDISKSGPIPINSHDTALCVIPPHMACGDIDRLRELYDKAYGKWPAHVNLIYPFVAPASLPRAQEQIRAYLDCNLDSSKPQRVEMAEAGLFKHRNNSTVFLQETRSQTGSCLKSLRTMALEAINQKPAPSNLHLTIGQSENNTRFSQQYLLGKARLLPSLRFYVGGLAILVRERSGAVDHMKLWGVIQISQPEDAWIPSSPEYWIQQPHTDTPNLNSEEGDKAQPITVNLSGAGGDVQSGSTYFYESQHSTWSKCEGTEQEFEDIRTLMISSYNVLIDTEYPPTLERDPYLLQTILSDSAAADILVLQEVSDDFLSYILNDPRIQQHYQYASHGPPNQPDIGPLLSLRNIVILSRWYFSCNLVPFHRKHKGALVAKFEGAIRTDSSSRQNLVVAGVHLTAGLTDSSVAAKKAQLQILISYLTHQHEKDTWLVAGDFNLATSSYTIDTALEDQSITNETVTALSSIETAFSEVGLIDTWAVAHVEGADEVAPTTYDELFEGEEGATFDPRNNVLAAATSGTSMGRPQRYDRIFVRSDDALRVSRCNHFGLPSEVDGAQVVPSDHTGIRSTLKVLEDSTVTEAQSLELVKRTKVKLKRASSSLSQLTELKSVLATGKMFPTGEEVQQRKLALEVLRRVVLSTAGSGDSEASDIPMVIVPVGSYALGVWTADSDIDCLCIGTISSKTFFKLARQRLVKAQDQGVRVLRKVEANTGTMLELSVNDVAMDLQYCPAARIVER